MFIAVSIWKRFLACDIKILGVFLCVGVFILCGFEHCIANMFYINLSGMLNQDTALWLGRITAGNMLGGLIVPAIGKVLKEISAD
jgi:formate/nitrite transporter FocA (FNT family)